MWWTVMNLILVQRVAIAIAISTSTSRSAFLIQIFPPFQMTKTYRKP
jgi:hypothetical protein